MPLIGRLDDIMTTAKSPWAPASIPTAAAPRFVQITDQYTLAAAASCAPFYSD
ncbi:hypothetical protein VTO73DRAFT_9818 [Trametes versicolor]